MVVMNKKTIFIAAALILLMVTGVKASFWIYSNIVHVDYAYTFTLMQEHTMSSVTLTATLTYNTLPLNGALVSFFLTNSSGGAEQPIGTAYTNTNGIATYVYAVPGNGSYYFKAGYQSP